MGRNIQKAPMTKCSICKTGTLRPGMTNVTHERDGHVVVVKNVPAEICDTCGEYYLDADIAQAVYDMAEAALSQGRQFEVLAFAA
jgi:YgiT-type zinc finger domain-containing protein